MVPGQAARVPLGSPVEAAPLQLRTPGTRTDPELEELVSIAVACARRAEDALAHAREVSWTARRRMSAVAALSGAGVLVAIGAIVLDRHHAIADARFVRVASAEDGVTGAMRQPADQLAKPHSGMVAAPDSASSGQPTPTLVTHVAARGTVADQSPGPDPVSVASTEPPVAIASVPARPPATVSARAANPPARDLALASTPALATAVPPAADRAPLPATVSARHADPIPVGRALDLAQASPSASEGPVSAAPASPVSAAVSAPVSDPLALEQERTSTPVSSGTAPPAGSSGSVVAGSASGEPPNPPSIQPEEARPPEQVARASTVRPRYVPPRRVYHEARVYRPRYRRVGVNPPLILTQVVADVRRGLYEIFH